MSRRLDRKRSVLVQRLSITAASLWIILILFAVFNAGGRSTSPRTGNPVLSNFSAIKGDVARITITDQDVTYNLIKRGDAWLMEESGAYPVREDRLNTLLEGLETLSWGERRTSNPERLSLLALGDPREEGNGTLIELFSGDGARVAEVITGRRNEYTYARKPDETIAFRVRGDLPPLRTREAWLDLDIMSIEPSAVSAVRITGRGGNSVYLSRPAGSDARSFRPAPPYQDFEVTNPLAVSATALAITRLAPIDVKSAEALSGRAVSRHISETFDGLEIDLRAWRETDGYWVTLRAIEAGEGARRARTINERAEPYAFKLTEYDWLEFTPSVSELVARPTPEETSAPLPPADFQP